jgi:arabinogalactan oligomer/maltooligosaccharide transport system permease protein
VTAGSRWVPTLVALFWGLLAIGSASAAEITVWHAYRGAEEAALADAARRFDAETGHTTRLQAVPFGAYTSKLETAIPRGNGPDLFIASHDNLGKWTELQLIEPLAGPPTGHVAAAVDALTREGAVWGQPLAYKSVLLLYDPSRVDAPPATTDALLAIARREVEAGRYGLAWQASEPYFHAGILHAFGGRALEADGSAKLDTDAHIAAYAYSKRLAFDEGIAPAQPTAALIGQLYDQGQVAFVFSGPWFTADRTRPVAAAPLPVVSETGEPMAPYLTVEAAFQVPGGTPEAADLAAFLAKGEGARIRARGGQAVSDEAVTVDDPLLRMLQAQARTAVPMPSDSEVSNAFEAIARSLRAVQRGAVTPEAAARDAQEYYDILSRPLPPEADPRPWIAFGVLVLVGALGYAGYRLSDPDLRARIRSHRDDYLWIAPAGLAMSVLVVLPFVTGAAVSLFAHKAGEWRFVGLANFLDIALARDWPITSSLSFGFTLLVTILWTTVNVALHLGIGMGMAMLLREPWVRMRSVWRALLIVPWAVPNYITALIWKGLFHAQFGAVNALLGFVLMRGEAVELDWFARFSTAFTANLVTNTWLGFPFMMVVTLGALQSIPRELEEAAEVDGASRWFAFRHVTWPMLKPALLPAVVLGSVWTFNMFNVIYLVSGGEPNSSSEILISEAYRWAFSLGNRYGYAAAYAVLIFGVLLVYSRSANRLVGQKVL